MVQFAGEAYTAGVEIVERDGATLRVYGVAKTVADCFKHRNKIGLDVAVEALKDARARNRTSIDDIWRFAKVCRVAVTGKPVALFSMDRVAGRISVRSTMRRQHEQGNEGGWCAAAGAGMA